MNSGALGTGPEQAGELAVGRRWVFGPGVLDERTLELTVAGENIRLERKPLEVLLYLLHHAGEVVTKDELLQNLWPGRILSDTVLTRHISVLRQALKDDEHTLIRTAHGFGYRLDGEVRVVETSTPPPPAFKFEAGDSPPLRPHWKLVERLGTGGHGEAWLARHEKTGDARVFKFALDERAVASLKREITLYRVLHDSLGERAAVARILEWNLEEAPYFLEVEYVAGRDLRSWLESQGGAAAVPLPARLELVAQIADAVAAAHAVGVLHKDLKPGNILVHVAGGQPSIKLCDFGIGGVVDPARLEALGITKLGFTKTQAGLHGTPLYIAPEVMAGQPFTVKADAYALGVLLYQMVIGNLQKPLAAGWELEVRDELLLEDIMDSAAGDPDRRIADAAKLADRLRKLNVRRHAWEADKAARERAERARKIAAELRRTRLVALLLLALAVAAVSGGISAYKARNRAITATEIAKAVSDFLLEDVFQLNSAVLRPSDASYEAMLQRAAAQVDSRLAAQPEAAATLHWLLGRRYSEVGDLDSAIKEYGLAAEIFTRLNGRFDESTLLVLDKLAWTYAEDGRVSDALGVIAEAADSLTSAIGPSALTTLLVRTRLARTLLMINDYGLAEDQLREVTEQLSSNDHTNSFSPFLFKEWLGVTPESQESARALLASYANMMLGGLVLEESGIDYVEAEHRLRQAFDYFLATLGPENDLTALTGIHLGMVLASVGKYAETEPLILRSQALFDSWFPPGHYARGLPRIAFGRLRMEQQRPNDALAFFKEAVAACERQCPTRVRIQYLMEVARAYRELGLVKDAEDVLRTCAQLHEAHNGSQYQAAYIRIELAGVLRERRKERAAEAILARVAGSIASFPEHGHVISDYQREAGLLALQRGDHSNALNRLRDSHRILARRLGADHWRAQRVRRDVIEAERLARH